MNITHHRELMQLKIALKVEIKKRQKIENDLRSLTARIDPRLLPIPIVVFTTSRAQNDLWEAYNLSVAGYIVKPMDFSEFISALKKVYEYWLLCEYPESL